MSSGWTCPECGKITPVPQGSDGEGLRCACGRAVGAEATPGSRRLLMLLGGLCVLAVLALGFAGTVALLMHAAGKSDGPAAPEVSAPPQTPAPAPTAAPKSGDRMLSNGKAAAPAGAAPPAAQPRPEAMTKTLAGMDKLMLPIPPPQPTDAPAPEVWPGHTASIRGVAFTDDGRFVVSVSGAMHKDGAGKEDNSIRVWDARRGKEVRKLDGFREALDAVSVSPGGRFAVFGHNGHYADGKWVDAADHAVHLWDIQENRELYFQKKPADPKAAQTDGRLEGLDSSVFSTAFSPDRQRVVGVANSGTMAVWDTQNGNVVVKGKVQAVPRPRLDAASGATVPYTLAGVNCVRFTPDSRWLLTGGGDYSVRLFDAASGQPLASFDGHRDIVWAVAAGKGRDGRLYGLSAGGGQQRLRQAGFEPGASDFAIRLWDLEKRQEVRRFVGHEKPVSSLVFCPNGRHFLSAGDDRTVMLWDLATGVLLRAYRGHTGLIRSVAVSPDGRAAVSGGDDCTLRYWRLPVPPEDLADALARKDLVRLTETLADIDTMGPDVQKLYPRFFELLREKDDALAPLALSALRRLGRPDAAWAPALGELLADPWPDVRLFAAQSLGQLGADARPALPGLRKALDDGDRAVRRAVLIALGNLGKEAGPAVPDLERLVDQEKDEVLRTLAFHALGKIGGKNRAVLAHLRKAVAEGVGRERSAALKSLIDLGPEADDLEPCLKAFRDPASRDLARTALEKIPPAAAEVPTLERALGDDGVEVRLLAVSLLRRMGPDVAGAKPALLKAVKDRDARVRFEAARAQAARAPDDKETAAAVMPALIEPLKGVKATGLPPRPAGAPPGAAPQANPPPAAKPDDKDPKQEDVRRAREAIVQLGAAAAPALFQALHQHGGDTEADGWTRYQIYQTFIALGPKAATFQVRSGLNQWAKKEQQRVRRYGTSIIFDAALQATKAVKGDGR